MAYFKRCISAATVVLLLTSCSSSGSDESEAVEAATDSPVAQIESEVADSTEAAEEEDTDAEAATDVDDEASLVGRTGPIRELPGLAQWADLDLRPFVAEVMMFPDEVPIPNNAVLTWIDHTQYFRDEDSYSWIAVTARLQPMFSIEEFRTLIPELIGSGTYTATGIDEDLEDHSVRLEFGSEDASAAFSQIIATYTEADATSQAELYIYARGNDVAGIAEVMVNEALFPWVNDIQVDSAMSNDFVTYNIGRLDGKAELDRRWNAPSTDFERLSDIYRVFSEPGLTIDGEMEYKDSPWPWNEIYFVREDGFDGSIIVSQSDPERELTVIYSGRYLLE